MLETIVKNIETLYEDHLRCKCDFKESLPLSLSFGNKAKNGTLTRDTSHDAAIGATKHI